MCVVTVNENNPLSYNQLVDCWLVWGTAVRIKVHVLQGVHRPCVLLILLAFYIHIVVALELSQQRHKFGPAKLPAKFSHHTSICADINYQVLCSDRKKDELHEVNLILK